VAITHAILLKCSGPLPGDGVLSAALACYDLVSPDTLGCPPWLAIRYTGWSDKVRPNFRNTKRTMFRTLAGS
jgi:hypothetical protein